MASQRDVKNKIASVKNIQKITRAMEMVAAARLRRAEQRIAALRPYADAIGRMTRQAAQAAGAEADAGAAAARARVPDERRRCCWSPATAASRAASTRRSSAPACASPRELAEEGLRSSWYATGRRGVSSLAFRGHELERQLHGLRRPTRLRGRAHDRRRPDPGLRRRPRRSRGDGLQLLRLAAHPARHAPEAASALAPGDRREHGESEPEGAAPGQRALVDYEPDPEKILRRLVPDYIEISIYRALVESAAGFFGAQMTAMRSASENAGEIITDYTLQMNRARQAEITQEIMEVVAGAEGLS